MSDKQQSSRKKSADVAALSKQAEEQTRNMDPTNLSAQTPEELQQMLHELRMQNEELRTAQVEAERARYLNFYDLAPVGYCILSENGVILEANRTTATLLGVIRSALVKQPLTRFIIKEDQDIYYRHRKQLLESGEPQECDLRLVKPDGALFWAHLSGIVAQVEDGAPVCNVMLSDITGRKQAEEELRESELTFRKLFEKSSDAILLIDETGVFVDCNQAALDLLKMTREQFLFLPPENISPEFQPNGHKSKESALEMIELAYKKVLHRFDWTFVNAEGGEFIVEVSLMPIVVKGKTMLHATWRDITERKLGQEALAHSYDLMRYIIEHNRSCVAVHDRDLKYIYVSQRYLDEYKVKEKDVIGKHHYDVFPDLPQKWRDVHQKALAGEISSAEDDPYEREDGTVDWTRWECRPWYEADGSIGGIIIYTEVITERKQTEETLRESEERLRLSLQAANQGLYDLNVQTGAAIVNREYTEMLGYDPETFIETNAFWIERLHPEDHEITAKAYSDYVNGLTSEYRIVFRQKTKDGQWKWILSLGKIVEYDADGKPLRMVGTHTDITERKQAEAEREKLQAQLLQAQKMESVGRLAGGVAHDFNNMLGVILGCTELALDRVGPDEPLHADLEEIQKAAQRSADLTRQLLAFARKQTVAPRVLDLNDNIESMCKLLRRLIGEDIDLAWRPGKKIWPVKMDPAQIDQILANLCVNARDAIAGVGKVTIETDKTSFDEEYCTRHPGFVLGDYVLLAVSDNGCGMDAEIKTHLFEPFFTTKKIGKGTGLGLATVYGAVKQNNGFINVYSEPGQGTTFKIYLPRHAAKAALETEERQPLAADRGIETILLVEDEPAILKMTARMLERLGYKVLAAGTPGEAVHLAQERSGRIDLLMTDVVMPEMNGRDLAKNLLSIYPDIRRLFMSGYTANVIAHHGVLDEGVHFIQKPFSMSDLGVKLRETLVED